jgi:hypothetical protein
MAEKAARIQGKGIQLMSGFIIGFDADPDDIADRMTACIQELGIPQAMIGLLNALPDTDLYDRLDAEKRISAQTTGNNTHAFAMNFRPARPEADVLRDYRRVLERAYPADMKSYFGRCAVLRERWPAKSDSRQNLPLGWKLKVAAKYFAKVAASPYRFAALGFLLKTLAIKPSFLEQAIELGIKGHHHWVITRQAFEVDSMRTALAAHLDFVASHIQRNLESLEAAFGKLMPSPLQSGGNALEGMLSFLGTIGEMRLPDAEIIAMREKIEEAVAGISQYGKQVGEQMEAEFRRLSRSARATLADDMERFLLEVNRLCAVAPPAH